MISPFIHLILPPARRRFPVLSPYPCFPFLLHPILATCGVSSFYIICWSFLSSHLLPKPFHLIQIPLNLASPLNSQLLYPTKFTLLIKHIGKGKDIEKPSAEEIGNKSWIRRLMPEIKQVSSNHHESCLYVMLKFRLVYE